MQPRLSVKVVVLDRNRKSGNEGLCVVGNKPETEKKNGA